MTSFLKNPITNFDAGYRDQPYIDKMKARLLALFSLLVLLFVPLNVAKLLFAQLPGIEFRLFFNFTFFLAGLLALYWLPGLCG